ncbi:vegetative cell wall protein gp1-like isoform X1 [Rosa rugosa]|uniref:vegetative cell wall protein gp1-like isoform X1 n=1 Tax=Rosa rugosa TaxID=74645 RepID=UPI002B403525|nr:vegetative cell wall protein gp1-like isoform X1 [Rosa rugosa]
MSTTVPPSSRSPPPLSPPPDPSSPRPPSLGSPPWPSAPSSTTSPTPSATASPSAAPGPSLPTAPPSPSPSPSPRPRQLPRRRRPHHHRLPLHPPLLPRPPRRLALPLPLPPLRSAPRYLRPDFLRHPNPNGPRRPQRLRRLPHLRRGVLQGIEEISYCVCRERGCESPRMKEAIDHQNSFLVLQPETMEKLQRQHNQIPNFSTE